MAEALSGAGTDTLLRHIPIELMHSIEPTDRFRRLAKDYERLPETLIGLHFPLPGNFSQSWPRHRSASPSQLLGSPIPSAAIQSRHLPFLAA